MCMLLNAWDRNHITGVRIIYSLYTHYLITLLTLPGEDASLFMSLGSFFVHSVSSSCSLSVFHNFICVDLALIV